MRLSIISALLYAAMSLGANIVHAEGLSEAQRSILIAARTDDMRKLQLHQDARAPVLTEFTDENGASHSFADSDGKYRLVNFWATWCAPCREEMPSLAALKSEFGGDNFDVIAIATGRNRLAGIHDFYEENQIFGLDIYLDPKSTLAREMHVTGLPVTLILDPNGLEIARLIGGADWHGEAAKTWITLLLTQE